MVILLYRFLLVFVGLPESSRNIWPNPKTSPSFRALPKWHFQLFLKGFNRFLGAHFPEQFRKKSVKILWFSLVFLGFSCFSLVFLVFLAVLGFRHIQTSLGPPVLSILQAVKLVQSLGTSEKDLLATRRPTGQTTNEHRKDLGNPRKT